MGFFRKLFSRNKVNKNLSKLDQLLNEVELELEISFDDESKNLDENDYKYSHCFLFYGLNDEAFTAVEKEVWNFAGPNHLSLLKNNKGAIIASLCELNAGIESVNEAIKSYDDSLAYVDKTIDQNLEAIKEHYDSQIGEECLNLINTERPFIVENIRCAMKIWAESEFFQKEPFIGAMIVFVKSSKELDRRDQISENQNGMNLPLVASGGFLRTCIFATEDVMNVKYSTETIEEKLWKEVVGGNPRNEWNYAPISFSRIPFGFNYFDQEGQLWRISDVSKSVELASEWKKDFINDAEEGEYYISH